MNLPKEFEGLMAVFDVSFSVERREILAIIGPNGAGKTTTLRTVSGLLPPREGRVVFDGQELNGVPAHRIVNMGISQAPEGRKVFTTLTVQENLNMGAYSLGGDKGAIEENRRRVFELFPRLEERKSQIGGTLSGGEQQMLALGRALMSRPKLMCIDEPSTGLAPILRRQVFEKIGEIRNLGITLLLVEQEVSTVFKMASRNYVLSSGKIIAQGTGEQLLEDEVLRKTYLGL